MTMGNTPSSSVEEVLRAELHQLRLEMSSFQKRLAGLERDVPQLGIAINACHDTSRENSNNLLNISLLEEGRSVYRKPKRHTASTYK